MEQEKLPNATLILVFGILSIITCCCYGILGIILGVVALILANKATAIYMENPDNYTDFGNVKAGKILAIIGIVLSLLMIVFLIYIVSAIGWDVLQSGDEELLKERLVDLFQ